MVFFVLKIADAPKYCLILSAGLIMLCIIHLALQDVAKKLL